MEEMACYPRVNHDFINSIDILTNCKYTVFMIMELLKHKDYIRVLMALESKPLRFNRLQNVLKLNPTQVDRALNFLRKELWIIPRTIPSEGNRIIVEYSLGKRGEAFLQSFKTFGAAAEKRKSALGASEVAELQGLYR